MNTKHYLPLALLLLFLSACNLFTVRGSGNIVTESREVRNFNRVVFGGAGELLLTQGDEESLAVTVDDNLVDYIEAEVKGDTLYIGLTDKQGGGTLPSQPVRFNLTVKELNGLNVAGTVSAKTGEIVTEDLAVKASGSSNLQIAALEAETLALHLSGTNEIVVTGVGDVTEQELVISGSGNFHAPGLRSRSVDVTINGTGKATVWAADFLDISISGNGSLDYYGNPHISQNASGNAHIEGLGIP